MSKWLLETKRWPLPVIKGLRPLTRFHLWDEFTSATWCSDQNFDFLTDDLHGGSDNWALLSVTVAVFTWSASVNGQHVCSGCKRRFHEYRRAKAILAAREARRSFVFTQLLLEVEHD